MYTVKGTHHLSRRAALQAMPATWAGGSSRLSLAAGGWVCFCTTFLPAFLSFFIHVCAPYIQRAQFSTREHNCLKTTRIPPCGNMFNLGGGMIRLVWNTLHFRPGGPIHQIFHGTTHPEPPPPPPHRHYHTQGPDQEIEKLSHRPGEIFVHCSFLRLAELRKVCEKSVHTKAFLPPVTLSYIYIYIG